MGCYLSGLFGSGYPNQTGDNNSPSTNVPAEQMTPEEWEAQTYRTWINTQIAAWVGTLILLVFQTWWVFFTNFPISGMIVCDVVGLFILISIPEWYSDRSEFWYNSSIVIFLVSAVIFPIIGYHIR